MRIPLDRQSTVPLYKQIETYLRDGILCGNLAADMRLPATRQLANALGVNRITVETAYMELEADGLVFSRMGSGTYVLPSMPLLPPAKQDADDCWHGWQQNIFANDWVGSGQTPDEMLKTAGHPYPVDFSPGLGDARLFPAEDFRKVIQTVMRRDGAAALEYGEFNGYAPLRTTIAHVLASQGLSVHPDNILITAGSQQALALVAQLLLKPGDVVLVEKPTYSGALDLFRMLRVQVVGIPLDERGMQVEKLEPLLQQFQPRLIYSIPNFQNPTGTCLGSQRRRQLIALADRYNVPILEDDFVGDLRYDGRAQPALKALDPGGRVIYVSTFSKMLMPGLRVGFLVAEGPVYEGLLRCKHASDLATSNLMQRALEAYVTVGRYQAHLRHSCQVYRKRRDTMLHAIQSYLPAGIHLTPPQGGFLSGWNCPIPFLPTNCSQLPARQGSLLPLATSFSRAILAMRIICGLTLSFNRRNKLKKGSSAWGKCSGSFYKPQVVGTTTVFCQFKSPFEYGLLSSTDFD